jgi:hypothetical protein
LAGSRRRSRLWRDWWLPARPIDLRIRSDQRQLDPPSGPSSTFFWNVWSTRIKRHLSRRVLRQKLYANTVVGSSNTRAEFPCLPPVLLLALPSIAVAGPNVPCSIAPCRRTSPPGSNSPATVDRALPAQPMSNASSAAISKAGFSRMALPALDAPSAVTIFSLPGRARAVVSVPLATPGEWSKPPPIWPTTFFRDCRSASGCCRFRSGCVITSNTIRRSRRWRCAFS